MAGDRLVSANGIPAPRLTQPPPRSRTIFDETGINYDDNALSVILSTKFQPDLSHVPELQSIDARLPRPVPRRPRLPLPPERRADNTSSLLAGAGDPQPILRSPTQHEDQ